LTPERVTGGGLCEPGFPDGAVNGTLEDGLMQMIRENPLPGPFAAGGGVLPCERVRQLDPAGARGEVAFVESTHPFQVALQRCVRDRRQDRHAVLVALPAAHDELMRTEIDIFHA
jgi:hypothetical protein